MTIDLAIWAKSRALAVAVPGRYSLLRVDEQNDSGADSKTVTARSTRGRPPQA